MNKPLLFRFKSKIENAGPVQKSIIDKATDYGFDEDALFCLRLAMDESIINAIVHGNRSNPDKDVAVSVLFDGDLVTVSVRDEGDGFDPAKLADPRQEPYLHQPTGRGVFLIREFTKSVCFNEKGNEITFTIHRSTTIPMIQSN